jgi:hypothetical protein
MCGVAAAPGVGAARRDYPDSGGATASTRPGVTLRAVRRQHDRGDDLGDLSPERRPRASAGSVVIGNGASRLRPGRPVLRDELLSDRDGIGVYQPDLAMSQ